MSSRDEKLLKIAQRLCYKDIELPLSDCFKDKKKWFCSDSDKCEIDILSDKQLEYIVSDINNHTFLEACPGSGKTEVVGIKAAYEISNWKNTNSGIAILTFTKNAAKEIQNRVSKYIGHKAEFPHFIGTIDSWLHQIILHPFGHLITQYKGKDNDKSYNIIDSKSNSDFMKNKSYNPMINYLSSNDNELPIYCNKYSFDFEKKDFLIELGNNNFYLKEYIKTDNFNNWKNRFKERMKKKKSDISWITDSYLCNNFSTAKKNFWKGGFCTYQDAENISFNLLRLKKDIKKLFSNRFKNIIIDECQDLSYAQLCILFLLKNNSVFHFIGDLNQAIYQFRKVNPDNVIKFVRHFKFKEMCLTDNYRSNQDIVDVCSKILPPTETISGNAANNFDEPFLKWYYEKDKYPELYKKYVEYLESVKIPFDKSVVLGRGYSLLSKIDKKLNEKLKKQHKLALSLHYWNKPNQTKSDIENALNIMGSFLSQTAYKKVYCNSQYYYTPEKIDKIEWRYILSKFLKKLSNSDWSFEELTISVWLKKIKENVKSVWSLLPNEIEEYKLSGSTTEKIKDCISEDLSYKIKLTTIHKVKGQTYESVMLVSAQTRGSDGGHWSHWLTGTGEQKRLGYVASSRPRKLLIWAIPEKDKDEFDKVFD